MTFIISYRISLGEGKVPRMAGDLQTAVSFAGGAAAADLHLERIKEAAHTSKDTANKTKARI